MRLTVLGSGSGVPTATRGCPGFLVRTAAGTILVDPGPGALAAAARRGVAAGEVAVVLVTHLHLDHHLDLAALLFALRHPRFAGRPPLRVRGPAGLLRTWGLWREAYGHWVEPRGWELDLAEAAPGTEETLPGGLRIGAVEVPHGTAPALGWRIREREDGPLLAFSGDTGEGPGAAAAGREADLFVLECALPEGASPEKHLTPAAAGRVAAASRCRRLLLVHFTPESDGTPVEEAVRAAYGGPLDLADDGFEADVGS